MIFSPINVRKALTKERNHQREVVRNAERLLEAAARKDSETLSKLRQKSSKSDIVFTELPDTENIFSIDEIRNICIRYRLRFLESSFFKAKFPYAAIVEINAFEKKHDVKINSFRIIAPSKAFDLENINKDPLLFAQLTDQSFYLIHQWGHDLAWYRKIFSWPLQNFKTLMITLGILCGVFAFSLPASIMNILNFQSEIYLRLWLTVHTFIGLLGLTLWIGLSFDKNFSEHSWNSKYYNF
jgi:hypothetical protein